MPRSGWSEATWRASAPTWPRTSVLAVSSRVSRPPDSRSCAHAQASGTSSTAAPTASTAASCHRHGRPASSRQTSPASAASPAPRDPVSDSATPHGSAAAHHSGERPCQASPTAATSAEARYMPR